MGNSERRKERMDERMRCLGLVEDYRDQIEVATARLRSQHGNHREMVCAYEIADKIVASLRVIEDKIKHPDRKEADFSLEEMALAERIIDEQNKNPFEVEP